MDPTLRRRLIWARCERNPRYFFYVRRNRLLSPEAAYPLSEHVFLDIFLGSPEMDAQLRPLQVLRSCPIGLFWGARAADAAAFAIRYWTGARIKVLFDNMDLDKLCYHVPANVGNVLMDCLMVDMKDDGDSTFPRTLLAMEYAPLDSRWRPWLYTNGGDLYCAILRRERFSFSRHAQQYIRCAMLDEMGYCDPSALCGLALRLASQSADFDVSLLGLQVVLCAEARGIDTAGWKECWRAINRSLMYRDGGPTDVHALLIQALPEAKRALVDDAGALCIRDARSACVALFMCPSAALQLPSEAVERLVAAAADTGDDLFGTDPYNDEVVCLVKHVRSLLLFKGWLDSARNTCLEGVVNADHAYAVLRVVYDDEPLARELWPSLFGDPHRLGMFLGQFDREFLRFTFAGRGSRGALALRAEAARAGNFKGPGFRFGG